MNNELAKLVWAWWLQHKSDSFGDRNVYDCEPDFVEIASSQLSLNEKADLREEWYDSL